jgi:hypothetical protein
MAHYRFYEGEIVVLTTIANWLYARFGTKPVAQQQTVPLAFVIHLITAAGLDLNALLEKISATYVAHNKAAEEYRKAQVKLELNAREAQRLADIVANQAEGREASAAGVKQTQTALEEIAATGAFSNDQEETDVLDTFARFLQQNS